MNGDGVSERRERVLIAIPDKIGWMRLEFVRYLSAAVQLNYVEGYPYHYEPVGFLGADTAALAFNVACTHAFDNGFDWCWIWDSDCGPAEASFGLMQIAGYDIRAVGLRNMVLDRASGKHVPVVIAGCVDENETRVGQPIDHPFEGPYEVHRAQTGGMAISRRVIGDQRLWLGPRDEDGVIPLFQDPRTGAGRLRNSCDYDFCDRAVALGYKIAIDPRAHSSHFKLVDVNQIAEYGFDCFNRAVDLLDREGRLAEVQEVER